MDPISIDLDGVAGDIAPFACLDDLAASARFAYLVEMDHCVHELYEFRLLCIRWLATHGWTWFGEEIDWRWGQRVDRYLASGDEAQLQPVDDGRWFSSGMFAADAPEELVDALHAERARFARQLRHAVPGARWFGFDSGGGDAEYVRRGNAARTWEDGVAFMAHREELMHRRVEAVAQAHPEAKVALMAGSTHLAKDDATLHAPGLMPAGGGLVPTIGHHVAHVVAQGPVLAIWLLHGGGMTTSPWLAPDGGTLVVPDHTLNARLAAEWDGPCLLRVDHVTDELAVAGQNNITMTCRPSEQVDAIVFTPTLSPVRS